MPSVPAVPGRASCEGPALPKGMLQIIGHPARCHGTSQQKLASLGLAHATRLLAALFISSLLSAKCGRSGHHLPGSHRLSKDV